MKLKKTQLSLILLALMAIGGSSAVYFFGAWDTNLPNVEKMPEEGELPVVSLEESFPYVIEPNTTLFSALRALDIPPATIQQIVDAAKPIQNLARIHPGIRFQTIMNSEPTPQLEGIQFHYSALEQLDIRKTNGIWTAKKIIEKVDLKTVTFTGTVSSSLWESAVKAKMDPDLISELADIFGWEVDFAREVRVNDQWRISVEQKLVKGTPIGWGAILAAEYVNAGVPFQATLFRLNGEDMGYYNPEGGSLRKMFLKSPIRYGRITSGFNKRRFHPILQIFRAHQGVDYGAPIGTPVRAVGDGTVIMAQRSGGGGNVVKLRHNSTYQTAYKHLKGFAPGVRKGTRVRQGQIVGYVGNTGMSTGPHLHFEFYQSGAYVDPMKKSFPSADPVPKSQLATFKSSAKILLASLPAYDTPNRQAASVPSTQE
jgi:murein DD-endopeptidase MepM/ murein hydrolase activator NlpD